ncbi:hypothetical protein [Methylorubrum extorquens]|uniref:Uncharacterized protein n=1 Tax=Methylorubrum extorquens (strain CM4 / NCIMB 13688) TaxID=440085 RepID=B7L176_METC4|nr:hypothetical protein [Methylorubrum extorquens]ACK84998.1 conserved hypothetical protein [Methylorubrum extorquens CM4]
MSRVQYDSFGEPILVASDKELTTASRVALRSGVGLFWVMVVAIVAARAAYFDPALSEKVASVAALFGHLRTVVGV